MRLRRQRITKSRPTRALSVRPPHATGARCVGKNRQHILLMVSLQSAAASPASCSRFRGNPAHLRCRCEEYLQYSTGEIVRAKTLSAPTGLCSWPAVYSIPPLAPPYALRKGRKDNHAHRKQARWLFFSQRHQSVFGRGRRSAGICYRARSVARSASCHGRIRRHRCALEVFGPATHGAMRHRVEISTPFHVSGIFGLQRRLRRYSEELGVAARWAESDRTHQRGSRARPAGASQACSVFATPSFQQMQSLLLLSLERESCRKARSILMML